MYEMLEHICISLGGIITSDGEIAWPASCVPQLMQLAEKNQWVVLGGDVLSQSMEHTYDNWYFTPSRNHSLLQNVNASIKKCTVYISEYTAKHGDNYYFVIVLSDTYLGG